MPFATLRKRPSEKPLPSGSGGVTSAEYAETPGDHLAEAVARQDATAEACRRLWAIVADADETTRERVRRVVDELLEAAEDAVDAAEAEVAMAEPGPSMPWEAVRAELGL